VANEWDAPEDAACSRDSYLGQVDGKFSIGMLLSCVCSELCLCWAFYPLFIPISHEFFLSISLLYFETPMYDVCAVLVQLV
jgi:hypothetical protein